MSEAQEDAAAAFRDAARDLLGRSDQRKRLREWRAKAPGFERAAWRALAEAGWLGILVPETAGGLGLGLREVAAVAEEVGAALPPEPFVAAGVQAVAALVAAPAGARRDALLESIVAGETIAALAWQSTAGQLAAGAPAVRAERRDGRITLSGTCGFVAPAAGAEVFLVHASGPADEDLLVAVDAEGVRAESETRIDGGAVAALGFERTAGEVIASGTDVRRIIDHANDAARVAQGAELLGVARRALALTVEYLGTRVQFDKKIGSFQALQHRVVDAYIQTELAAACIDDALAAHARGALPLGAAAARIKARAAQAAILTTRLAIQLHGAIGYTDEHDIGLYFKRALALSSLLGGVTALRRRYLALRPAEAARATAGEPAPIVAITEFPRDADWDAMPEPEFRRIVRAFFERHYPAHLRHMPYRVHWDEIKAWYFTLSRQGWIAPAWPKEFGGMALPPAKLIAFIEEQEDYGVARPPDQGLIMLGPLLIKHGTPEQRARFLPKILSGEHVWCQGYSEPNAGSDLAALRTEAVADGDDFLVTGQKIWTTLAQDATHIFMLVRTAKTGRKQEGISFLLADLKTPGVTVRPIRNIAGDAEFCEIFFDRVRVPRANLVGEIDKGWDIAKTLLGFERIFGGSPKHSQYALRQLERIANDRGLFADPVFAARYAELALDAADLSAAYAHFAAIVKRGGTLPASVSLLKVWATETHERIAACMQEWAHESGGTFGPTPIAGHDVHILAPWLNALAATIFSGTNEVQRNILATGVLGLPR